MGKTWVYIMSAGEHIKVGIADDPISRMKYLSTGCPYRITIEALLGPMDRYSAIATERSIHKHLKEFRCNGEWFKVSSQSEVFNSTIDYFGFTMCRCAPDLIKLNKKQSDPSKIQNTKNPSALGIQRSKMRVLSHLKTIKRETLESMGLTFEDLI